MKSKTWVNDVTYLQRPDAGCGLKAEADLFNSVEAGVLLWSAQKQSLVCPSSFTNRSGFKNAAANSAERGWPVILRQTGGGTVPQDSGILNLAMAMTVDKGFTIEEGYQVITRVFQSCLAPLGIQSSPGATPGSFCDGDWNLSVSNRKIVGTAQRWRPVGKGKTRIIMHGLILMHGCVKVGAAAVGAFHQDLGLKQIQAAAHTTLETELGPNTPDIRQLASALSATALLELEQIASPLNIKRAS